MLTEVLTGDVEGAGGRGLVDVYVMKHGLRDYLLSEGLESFKAPAAVKASIRSHLGHFNEYRASLSPFTGVPSIGWQAGWTRSQTQMLRLIEDMVYGDAFDGTLRTAVRAGKSPVDLLDYDSVKDKMEDACV